MTTARRRAAILAMVLLGGPAHAVTRHVPSEYATIAAAIQATAAGDTVEAACGTYYEHDIVLGDHLVLRSEDGSVDCATIDAQGLGRVMIGVALHDVTIEGFTMTHGHPASGEGGGLRLSNSSVTLRNCRFSNNEAAGGGGLYFSATTPRPICTNCDFVDNTAHQAGGGAEVVNVDFSACRFVGNTALEGGGLALPPYTYATLTVTGTSFRGNHADRGGAVSLGFSIPEAWFTGCTIEGNSADYNGSGLVGTGNYYLTQCVIARNVVDRAEGGAIWVAGDWEHWASATFTECTVAYNAPSAVWAWTDQYSNARVSSERSVFAFSSGPAWRGQNYQLGLVSCTDIFGNVGGDWTGYLAGLLGVHGNFKADPLFCDAATSDFTLRADSPCLPGNHPDGADCELIGAFGQGCGTVSVDAQSWGQIKASYREQHGAP